MQLSLNKEQSALAEVTAKFIEARFPRSAAHAQCLSPAPLDQRLWREAADLGWTLMLSPEEFGGGGFSGRPLEDLIVIMNAVGGGLTPGPLIPTNIVVDAVSRLGSAEHKAAHLEALTTGRKVATWVTPQELRGGAVAGQIAASQDAGEVHLRGRALYVEGARDADVFLVTAEAGRETIQALVERDRNGLVVSDLVSLDAGRTIHTVELDLKLRPDELLGSTATAAADVERQLDVAVTLQVAETVAIMDVVLNMTIEYARQRIAFGRPLASYQALKHRLADMRVWVEAGFAVSAALAAAVDSNSSKAPALASIAKAHVGDRAVQLVQDCVQIHGGIGVTMEHDLHLYLRRATVNRSLFGVPAFHRDRLCTLRGL